MTIDKNAVAKTGLKLNAFKNLLASTLTVSFYFIPGLIFLQLNQVTSTSGIISVLALSLLASLGSTIFLNNDNFSHPLEFSFWQNLFNKPFIAILKNQNEKIILKARSLKEQKSFSAEDYDWLAKNLLLSVSTSKYKDFEEMLNSEITLEKNKNKGLGIKDRAMINSLQELETYMNSVNPSALASSKDALASKAILTLNLSAALKTKLRSSNHYDINNAYRTALE